MSTPQDPRNSGRTPEDSTDSRSDPHEQASAERSSDTPDEPIIDPSSPQPPDDSQTSGHVPQPPDESAAAGAPQPPASTDPGPTEWARPAGSGRDDPPTEYLPKLLHRDSGGATDSGARPPGPGSPADDQPTQMMPEVPESAGSGEEPQQDKGSAAFTHGWQPGAAPPPGGDVPPQAWTARPEEQAPGQAWQPQHPGYSPSGGTPYPPPGPYGGQPDQPNAPSGWGAAPGGQSGWAEGTGLGAGDPSSGQPGWSPAPGGQPGQQGWGGGEQQAGGAAPGADPAAAGGGPTGWGGAPQAPGGQPGQPGWSGEQHGWGKGGQPGRGGPQQSSGGYPAYPPQQYQPYGAPQQSGPSGPQVLSIIGFVCAAVSLFFCPILFGPAGIVLGIIGHVRGEPLGKWAAITAAACLVLGFLLGILVTGTDMVPQG